MCGTSLLCGPRADLWLFYGFFCSFFVNGFLSVVTARKLLKVDLKREPTQMLGLALNFFYRRFPNALEIINIKSDP